MTEPGPGTVYGRGGVDVREPKRHLHPSVIALVAAAVVVAAVALGYGLLRDPADAQVTATPAAALPASSPAARASTTTSPAAEPFDTGSWLISPAGDEKRYLGEEDDFAELSSSDDPDPLTVVPGLADKDCFSFRDGDGEYLRHFDYRLRFDAKEDNDLYRADATFCTKGEPPATKVRLYSKNYPEYLLHRRSNDLYIDKPDGTDKFTPDSTFTVRAPR
jgi:Alpha-L-arabinofuranosidase B (ABFB) domain